MTEKPTSQETEAAPPKATTPAAKDEYVFPPAAASPKEVLDLKPNTVKDATEGPHEQIDPNTYVHMTKPGGGEFLAPLSNVEHYEAKGYKAGTAEDIPDLVAYWAAVPAAPTSKAKD